MKYNKLFAKIFAQRTNNNAQVAVALVAGLAAGAIISILFAPDKGSNIRRGIADQARGLGEGIKTNYSAMRNRVLGIKDMEDSVEPEVPHFVKSAPKRRKSDIKDLIHEQHVVEKQAHTEQPLG